MPAAKARDTAYVMVSRARYAKIAAYRAERGWTFPWYSSYGTDFNYDFNVTQDPAVAPTKEWMAGFEVIECADLDEAIEIASKHPSVDVGGMIEIRPFATEAWRALRPYPGRLM